MVFMLQIPGIFSISSKFFPTVMNLLKRLAEAGQGNTQAPEAPQAPQAPQPTLPRNGQNLKSQSKRQPQPVVPTPESSSSSTMTSPRNDNEQTSPFREADTEASSTS